MEHFLLSNLLKHSKITLICGELGNDITESLSKLLYALNYTMLCPVEIELNFQCPAKIKDDVIFFSLSWKRFISQEVY